MYLKHFGLREFPFSITPDTEYFFAYANAQEAINTVLMALAMGEGFIKITGEVGTGKSMLCRKVMGSLDDKYQVALILNPYREPQSLFLELCEELGAVYPEGEHENQYMVLNALTKRVMDLNESGRRVVIILDEAQAMPIATLEALRLLTNLESEKRKLVQIVIFGQPELDERLSDPSIRQLRQRITFSYRLRPLSQGDVKGYLRHRLMAAGHNHGMIFTRRATRALFRKSNAVPRLINILAHKSLMSAYGRGQLMVQYRDVQAAAYDTFSKHKVVSKLTAAIRRSAAGALGLIVAAVAFWELWSRYGDILKGYFPL
ncbi:MAG: ExeA family protein [Limnohabitans sp.]